MLSQQADLTVIEVEDYIAHPKPNGYKSFHMIIEIPVYLSDRVERVPVELQIRTIAMDLWANLEHKIHHRHEHAVPPRLLNELIDAADAAHRLDVEVQRLHDDVGDPHRRAGHPQQCSPRTAGAAHNRRLAAWQRPAAVTETTTRNSAGCRAWCSDRLLRRGSGRAHRGDDGAASAGGEPTYCASASKAAGRAPFLAGVLSNLTNRGVEADPLGGCTRSRHS